MKSEGNDVGHEVGMKRVYKEGTKQKCTRNQLTAKEEG